MFFLQSEKTEAEPLEFIWKHSLLLNCFKLISTNRSTSHFILRCSTVRTQEGNLAAATPPTSNIHSRLTLPVSLQFPAGG